MFICIEQENAVASERAFSNQDRDEVAMADGRVSLHPRHAAVFLDAVVLFHATCLVENQWHKSDQHQKFKLLASVLQRANLRVQAIWLLSCLQPLAQVAPPQSKQTAMVKAFRKFKCSAS